MTKSAEFKYDYKVVTGRSAIRGQQTIVHHYGSHEPLDKVKRAAARTAKRVIAAAFGVPQFDVGVTPCAN